MRVTRAVAGSMDVSSCHGALATLGFTVVLAAPALAFAPARRRCSSCCCRCLAPRRAPRFPGVFFFAAFTCRERRTLAKRCKPSSCFCLRATSAAASAFCFSSARFRCAFCFRRKRCTSRAERGVRGLRSGTPSSLGGAMRAAASSLRARRWPAAARRAARCCAFSPSPRGCG